MLRTSIPCRKYTPLSMLRTSIFCRKYIDHYLLTTINLTEVLSSVENALGLLQVLNRRQWRREPILNTLKEGDRTYHQPELVAARSSAASFEPTTVKEGAKFEHTKAKWPHGPPTRVGGRTVLRQRGRRNFELWFYCDLLRLPPTERRRRRCVCLFSRQISWLSKVSKSKVTTARTKDQPKTQEKMCLSF